MFSVMATYKIKNKRVSVAVTLFECMRNTHLAERLNFEVHLFIFLIFGNCLPMAIKDTSLPLMSKGREMLFNVYHD